MRNIYLATLNFFEPAFMIPKFADKPYLSAESYRSFSDTFREKDIVPQPFLGLFYRHHELGDAGVVQFLNDGKYFPISDDFMGTDLFEETLVDILEGKNHGFGPVELVVSFGRRAEYEGLSGLKGKYNVTRV